MKASFIIPFPVERLDNVLQTIRFLDFNHSSLIKESELILMCQNRCGHIDSAFSKTSLHNLELPCMQKSKLVNYAVKRAVSDIIVILDSDRILPKDYFLNVISSLEPKTAVTTKSMKWLTSPVNDDDIKNELFQFIDDKRSMNNKILDRNFFSGNVVMFKQDYLDTKGMDEFYKGYGFEDHDMTNILLKHNIELVWRDEEEIHLNHERLTYGTGNQKKMFLNNGLRYCKKWGIQIPAQLQEELDKFTRSII